MAEKNSPYLLNFTVNGATIPAYRIVKNAATAAVPRGVALWDTATAFIMGLSQEISSDATGGAAFVAVGGTAKANCGASVSAGALLTGLTATGEVVEVTAHVLNTTTTVVPRTVGQAMRSGSTAAAIEVYVSPNNLRVQFA